MCPVAKHAAGRRNFGLQIMFSAAVAVSFIGVALAAIFWRRLVPHVLQRAADEKSAAVAAAAEATATVPPGAADGRGDRLKPSVSEYENDADI